MELIEQIGAYAGFAAVVGLAVLSALYFSQARDVKRLREWAGRAPERAAQIEAEAQARAQASRVVAQPQAKPAAAPAVPGAKPAEAAAAQAKPAEAKPAEAKPAEAKPGEAKPAEAKPAAAPQPVTAQPAGPQPATPQPATPQPATPAARPAAATAAAAAKPGANGAGEPGKAPPIPPRAQPAATTSILPPSARAGAQVPWYRRIAWPEPRYLAVVAAGVIVIGGGGAFAISQLGGDDGADVTPAAQPGEGEQASGEGDGGGRPAAVDPSTVTVSVLNGTTIGGLAADVADEMAAEGFLVGNVDNALDQAKAESVVLYAEGARREAQAVQRVLDIPQAEPVDPDSQQRGGNASVVVVLGADRTP